MGIRPGWKRKLVVGLMALIVSSGCMSLPHSNPTRMESAPKQLSSNSKIIPVYAEELPKTIREVRTAKEALAVFESSIPLLTPEELDRLLMELEDFYLSAPVPIVDYRALTLYGSFVTPAMAAYLELMAVGSDSPALKDGSIAIPRTELGERALNAEQYLNDYPHSLRFDRVKVELDFDLGLLFDGSSNGGIYDMNRNLAPEVKTAWETAAAYDDTLTGKLAKEMLQLSGKLTSSYINGKITDETFYKEIESFLSQIEGRIYAQFFSQSDVRLNNVMD